MVHRLSSPIIDHDTSMGLTFASRVLVSRRGTAGGARTSLSLATIVRNDYAVAGRVRVQ